MTDTGSDSGRRDRLVQSQYEAYPYPERTPADEKTRLVTGSPSNLAELNHYVFGGRRDLTKPFSALVAGGGFQGGQVVGASDANGEKVKDRPVYPGDLIGSIYELLGIDPDANLPHPMNEIVKATPSPAEGLKLAGRLKEIM